VYPPGPGEMAGTVVALRPLPLEERLGLSVLELLLQIGPEGVSPVVPDDRAGAESDGPAFLLQPPADVDVVARDPELRVEAADRPREAAVARARGPPARGTDQAEGELARAVVGRVARAVVDDACLVVGVLELAQPPEAASEGPLVVIRADHDGDPRPGRVGLE